MSNEAIFILTPVGRLVGGHPMIMRPQVDDRTKQPKMKADGVTQVTEAFVALAIPKNGTTDWKATDWGQQIAAKAAQDWPGGQTARQDFAWKVVDGDSQIPNKRNKKPCDREGYPGHWVLHMSTGIPIKCYHVGKYDPTQQIQNENEIKPGDYLRVEIGIKGNESTDSPGIYLNPRLVELNRAGELIVLESGPSASEVFGGGAAPAANNAVPANNGAAPAPAPNAPDPSVLTPDTDTAPPPTEKKYDVNGQHFTETQLKASGWTDAQIAGLPVIA